MHPLTERTVFPASPWRANTASQSGGGVYSCYGTIVRQEGTTYTWNSALERWDEVDPIIETDDNITNCLFYANVCTGAGPQDFTVSGVTLYNCFSDQEPADGENCIGTWTGGGGYTNPGFVSDSFTGSNFHEFLHLGTDPMSPCIDRGITGYWMGKNGSQQQPNIWYGPVRYRDVDDSVGPLDGNPAYPDPDQGDPDLTPHGINQDSDMGADEAPTPSLGAFEFWYEER